MATDQIVITGEEITEIIAPRETIDITVLSDSQEVVIQGGVGPQGAPGRGVASGGDAGDVLVKLSPDDNDTAWTPLISLGGDKTFEQDFSASSTVTVTHGLGKFPSVSVFDTAGDEVEGLVTYNSLNSVTVAFSAPFSGKVIFN